MRGKICFLIGHRDASAEILPMIAEEVERHITVYGVTSFIVGENGSFDLMTAKAVLSAKERYPDVKLIRLIPDHSMNRIVEADEFDGILYPDDMEGVSQQFGISQANRYAVEHADYLIAYVWHPSSALLNIVEYAQSREKCKLITVTLLNNPT